MPVRPRYRAGMARSVGTGQDLQAGTSGYRGHRAGYGVLALVALVLTLGSCVDTARAVPRARGVQGPERLWQEYPLRPPGADDSARGRNRASGEVAPPPPTPVSPAKPVRGVGSLGSLSSAVQPATARAAPAERSPIDSRAWPSAELLAAALLVLAAVAVGGLTLRAVTAGGILLPRRRDEPGGRRRQQRVDEVRMRTQVAPRILEPKRPPREGHVQRERDVDETVPWTREPEARSHRAVAVDRREQRAVDRSDEPVAEPPERRARSEKPQAERRSVAAAHIEHGDDAHRPPDAVTERAAPSSAPRVAGTGRALQTPARVPNARRAAPITAHSAWIVDVVYLCKGFAPYAAVVCASALIGYLMPLIFR
jgi:hypothetical protein